MPRPVLIAPAEGVVPGLWNVEFTDGSRHELTTGQVRRVAVVGQCMAICPGCRADRWYGDGPCHQCGALIFDGQETDDAETAESRLI